ncbi:MAG: lamin tail domain-containing protein [Chloroflexota bacterium]
MPRRLRGLILSAIVAAVLLGGVRALSHRARAAGEVVPVVISEVAWGGTRASSSDEWIELYNAGAETVSLQGWRLYDSSGDVDVALVGAIGAGEFFLLERTDDDSVSDVDADQIYTGGLNNAGEALFLVDNAGRMIDTANGSAGGWPAGEGSPGYRSMERVAPEAADDDLGWRDHDGLTHVAHDAAGYAINGTPGQPNVGWTVSSNVADLVVRKSAPAQVEAGRPLTYRIVMSNAGALAAENVVLTDVMPVGSAYFADSSGLRLSQPGPGILVWPIGTVDSAAHFSFELTVTLATELAGVITNTASATTSSEEVYVSNNRSLAVSEVMVSPHMQILIDAALYDGYEANDADEAVRLRNVGRVSVDLAGWQLSDGSHSVALPSDFSLAAGDAAWLARDEAAFRRQFGFAPEVVLSNWPGFANDGDEIILLQPDGSAADVLVYEDGDVTVPGWQGPAVQPYRSGTLFAEEGQILYRRPELHRWWPAPDTDRATDWAQAREDVIAGRKVRYPGWNMSDFYPSSAVTQTATVTVAVAPDNAYETMVRQLSMATESIRVQALTFENLGVAQTLVDAARRGVDVTVLLEGDPVGGVTDQERYVCQRLENAGGACWFMIRDDAQVIQDRYRYLHAKFVIIDDAYALISSENLSPHSLPYDDKADGTWGRRGVLLVTDAPAVVDRLQAIFAHDFAPERRRDLLRWSEHHAEYGLPAVGFAPITATGGTTYTVQFPDAVSFSGAFGVEVIQSPENSLHRQRGLLRLLSRAGSGDTIVVQQLKEQPHWGGAHSDALRDPNPRLEAYVAAARRGARVRLLLDALYDDENSPLSNRATCFYVNTIAIEEQLKLRCERANPSGMGLHNKMVLAQIGGRGWVHVGSLNGTELSSKGNREVAIQVQSDDLYHYLLGLFEADWPRRVLLPVLLQNHFIPPSEPLISEIMYDPVGSDDAEFIEIANPGSEAVDLSHWLIGDALSPDDFEDMRRFPPGAVLPGQSALVIAATASGFQTQFGFLPDFEIVDSDPAVPELLDVAEWGDPAAILQLGNEGDEVWLRDAQGHVVDAVAYGAGAFPGLISCSLLPAAGYSLERYPYWQDTNDCNADFRAWPFPSPGALP